jgi:hypothetical protein
MQPSPPLTSTEDAEKIARAFSKANGIEITFPDKAPEARFYPVNEALDLLKSATIAFNSPERGQLGKQLIVEAKLSTKLDIKALRVVIHEPGTITYAPVKISDRMVATLAGGSSFEVSPSGPQEQWVSDSEPTSWTWQVTPKSVGENKP